MRWDIYLSYVLVMALVTYLIRMLPLAAFRRRITSRFIRSFLYYVPYAVLSAMTFPAMLYAAGSIYAAAAAMAVALFIAFKEKSLIIVALAASGAALIVQVLINIL